MTRWVVVAAALLGLGIFLLQESDPDRRRERPGISAERPETTSAWPVGLDDPDLEQRRLAAVELRALGDAAVPVFVDLLQRGDPEQRILAARSLGRMKRGQAELLAALDPADVALCRVILEAVARIGKPKDDSWALRLLAEPKFRLAALKILEARSGEVVIAVAELIDPTHGGAVNKAALQALGYAPGGVPEILEALQGGRFRVEALQALERMGPAAFAATSVMVELIREEERLWEKEMEESLGSGGHFQRGDLAKYDAAGALAAIGERAIPEVLPMLNDELAGVRRFASEILAKIGEAALPALIAASTDASARTRAAAAAALDAFAKDHPELLEVLVALSKDSDSGVRKAALASLGDFGRDATPALLAALDSTDADELDNALDSLRDVKANDPRLIPHLERLLTHDECTVQWSAADALGGMGAAESATVLAVALESADHFLRMSITEALVAIGRKSIPALLARVDRAPVLAQVVAISVFGLLKATSPEVRAACVRLLQSPTSSIRIRAAAFLAQFDEHQGVVLTTLRGGLEHKSKSVRQIAADGLGKMGSKARSALPDLLRLAHVEGEQDGGAKVHVYDALAAVGVADPAQLVSALASESWKVQYDAGAALERIGKPAVPDLVRCPPELRARVIPILRKQARKVPAAQQALRDWAYDESVAVRLLALESIWEELRDARAAVPGLLELAATNSTARYHLSRIGANAAFALKDLRALHAKTNDNHLAEAIRKIENR